MVYLIYQEREREVIKMITIVSKHAENPVFKYAAIKEYNIIDFVDIMEENYSKRDWRPYFIWIVKETENNLCDRHKIFYIR